jgi:hypothetical protein
MLRSTCCALALFAASLPLALRAPARVEASTVLKMRIEELAARCDVALLARVTSSSASIDASGRIATDYALEVERTFVGVHTAHRTIRVPGGVLPDGRGLVIPGMPAMVVGERAILFLSAANPCGERLPIGLSQGRLRVVTALDGTPSIVSESADLELVDADGHALPKAGPCTLPYAPTIQRIEAECARRPAGHAAHDARRGERR